MTLDLTTPRLRLTPITSDDRAALHTLMTQEPVRRYLCDGNVVPLEAVDGWIADSKGHFGTIGTGLWVARTLAEGTLVGLVGFMEFYDPPVLELIFALDSEHWGQGLATEMSRAIINDATMRVGMQTIRASTDEPNTGSQRTLKRLGMKEVGRDHSHASWPQLHYELSPED